MSDFFQVNPQLDVPIYQQLVDRILADIKTGKLPAGTQLPTVRKLADELNLAHGTIKRAYDELEQAGMVEKIQGRGTFVSYHPQTPESRKEQAMVAIDRLFDQLEQLNFSISEMSIFIKLKLQERAAQQDNLKVAVVECNPEILSQLCEQLRQISHVDLYSYLLEDVLAYPYKIEEEMDLVVTTQEHAEAIGEMMSSSQKIAKIALQPHANCISQIVKLGAGERVGILCQSPRFGLLMTRICDLFAPQAAVDAPCTFDSNSADYLRDKSAILVPESYERYADAPSVKTVEDFAAHGKVIACSYQIDDGSLMYLKEKLQKLWDRDKL